MSDEERQALIDGGTYAPSYMWNVNGWLCEKLGLSVKSQTQKCVPETYKEDIHHNSMRGDVAHDTGILQKQGYPTAIQPWTSGAISANRSAKPQTIGV